MDITLNFKEDDNGNYSLIGDPISQSRIPPWFDVYSFLTDVDNPTRFLFRNNADFNALAQYLHNCGLRLAPSAKWIPVLDPFYTEIIMYYKCSVCGRREATKEPFCNCGAKMKTE